MVLRRRNHEARSLSMLACSKHSIDVLETSGHERAITCSGGGSCDCAEKQR